MLKSLDLSAGVWYPFGVDSNVSSDSFDDECIDDFVLALRQLRLDHGQPSFGTIATRVTESRQRRSKRAIPACNRSTVYDLFRLGRNRVNIRLVRDVVLAITGDEDTALTWERRLKRVLAKVHNSPSITAQRSTHTVEPSVTDLELLRRVETLERDMAEMRARLNEHPVLS